MRPELVPQLKLISTTLSVTMKKNGIEFCFDTPYKTDHFASFILTDIKCGKSLPRMISTFNKKKLSEK